MPSKQRGPHPEDHQLFATTEWDKLHRAMVDLSWLKTRGYPEKAAAKLVGDRYCLRKRQRIAVGRSACSDDEKLNRGLKELTPDRVAECELHIDGFNLLTTIEAVIGGGVLLRGRDGCIRDMSSMHGNYRLLADTREAINVIYSVLQQFELERVTWYIDQPVSNSGRLKRLLEEIAVGTPNVPTAVEVVPDPDPILKSLRENESVVVSADSAILDSCGFWLNLATLVIAECYPEVQVLNFKEAES